MTNVIPSRFGNLKRKKVFLLRLHISQVEILRNAIYYIESLEALLSESERDETGRQKRWFEYLSSSCRELPNVEKIVTQKYCNLFWVVSIPLLLRHWYEIMALYYVKSILTEISASRQDRRVLQKSKIIRIEFLSKWGMLQTSRYV